MYKLLLVLVALAVCVFAAEKQDQEAAEQYFRTYGTYPSWYNAYSYGAGYPYAAAYTGAYAGAYAAPAYAYSGYKAAYPYSGYGYNYGY